jgi:hypothetical protein
MSVAALVLPCGPPPLTSACWGKGFTYELSAFALRQTRQARAALGDPLITELMSAADYHTGLAFLAPSALHHPGLADLIDSSRCHLEAAALTAPKRHLEVTTSDSAHGVKLPRGSSLNQGRRTRLTTGLRGPQVRRRPAHRPKWADRPVDPELRNLEATAERPEDVAVT